MVELKRVHLIEIKNMLRYLKGIIDYGLQYVVDCEFRLLGYTDSDWGNIVIDQKSTSRCCFNLGSATISWLSRKKTSVELSMVEA